MTQTDLTDTQSNILHQLFAIIEERKQNPPPGSYTASLFAKGENEILKKIGEEAVEVIIAANNEGDERVIYEMADMLYHSMVLLAARDLQWRDLEAELAKRFK
ncbi:MAG: phosphoribosyl-ATP diphosphatase [Chloroflexota bacterium]